MKYKLKEVKPKIFLLEMENPYDLAMYFLRYQEFYESPNKKFKGKEFSIIEFMEWYSKEHIKNNIFSYPRDWGGFNIPGTIIPDVFQLGIRDLNKYDIFMYKIYEKIYKKHKNCFYLIGSLKKDKETLKHEIAHGLYFTNLDYYYEMKSLISNIDKKTKNIMTNVLLNHMYCKEVIDDEIQAYFATGLLDEMQDELKANKIKINQLRKPFIDLFNKYYEL